MGKGLKGERRKAVGQYKKINAKHYKYGIIHIRRFIDANNF